MDLSYNLTNAVLSVNADGTYVMFSREAWKYAGEMTLLGMGMIFAVLASLWLVLTVFKLVFAGKSPKPAKVAKAPSAVAKAVEDSVVAVEEDTTVSVPDASDDALVAVITAAVAAYMADENGGEIPAGGFRVVSFRRTSGGRPWNVK